MPLSALVLATAAAASSPGTTIGRGTRGAHGAAMRNPVAVAQMRQSAMLQQMVPNAEMLEMVLAGSDAEPLPLRTNGSIVLLTPSLAEHRLSGTAQHRCMLTADVVRRFARLQAACTTPEAFMAAPPPPAPLLAVIAVKSMLEPAATARAVRERARRLGAPLLLDVVDAFGAACAAGEQAAAAAAQYDGLIVNNCALGALCSRKMYGKPYAVVEHFHSVRKPVRRPAEAAQRPFRRALTLQGNEASCDKADCNGTCAMLRAAVAPLQLDCALGGETRAQTFARLLKMPLKRAQRAVGKLGGAELFARLYGQYDLLVVWEKVKPRREYFGQPGQRPIMMRAKAKEVFGTAQRLINSLATGVPTVAFGYQTFRSSTEGYDVGFAGSARELSGWVRKLKAQPDARVHLAAQGILAARTFSPRTVAAAYASIPRGGTLRTRGGGCAGGGVWGALAERAQRWHDGSKAVAARLGRGATSALQVALHVLGAASVVCVAGAVVWRYRPEGNERGGDGTGLLAGAQ